MTKTKKKPTKKRSFLPFFLAVVIATGAYTLYLYPLENHQHTQIATQTKQNQTSIAAIEEHIATSLDPQEAKNQKYNRLIELAELNLYTLHHVETALSLLEAAQKDTNNLSETSQAALSEAIQTLSTHPAITGLDAIKTIEVIKEKLAFQLENQAKKASPHPKTPSPIADTTNQTWLEAFQARLKSAVIIRKTQTSLTPLPSDENLAILRENINFSLTLCQRALLESDRNAFEFGIESAYKALNQYPLHTEETRQMLEQIAALKAMDLTLPQIDFEVLKQTNNNKRSHFEERT